MSFYLPDVGDIVWIDLSPTVGREQAGHRPAAVLTPRAYNQRSGLMFCVPMTSRRKGYSFEVPVGEGKDAGVALVDQSRAVDWDGRSVRLKGRLTEDELARIRRRLITLVSGQG